MSQAKTNKQQKPPTASMAQICDAHWLAGFNARKHQRRMRQRRTSCVSPPCKPRNGQRSCTTQRQPPDIPVRPAAGDKTSKLHRRKLLPCRRISSVARRTPEGRWLGLSSPSVALDYRQHEDQELNGISALLVAMGPSISTECPIARAQFRRFSEQMLNLMVEVV